MKRIWLILSLFLSMSISSCYAAERLVVADSPTLLTGLLSIAIQKGYFAEQGLEIEIKETKTGDEATRAMFEGRADIATVAETAFVFDSFREQDFSLFATIGSWDNEVKIVARTDRNINSIADLRGKIVGTHPKISVHYFLSQALLKHGLTMHDIRPVFMKAAELPAALEAGEIDAFSLREPFIGEARQRLNGNVKIFEEPGLYWKSFGMVARNKTLTEHTAAIQAFLRALRKAEILVREQPDIAAAILAARLNNTPEKIASDLHQVKLRLSLEQRLVYVLENVASWAMNENLLAAKSMPNYLLLINEDALRKVKPNSVTIIR
ncbi:MAG: NrtA/SsuA/CpmA family ABC transporter substrate-binding protein [Proteobacteria bacterium]|nr:NrtA/SsuA/CpmA family ABC transporter substrate-binding protein [Pseudomonadota bacterium]